MAILSLEGKEAIVKKALSRGNKTVKEVARANNVGYSTLQRWIKRKREGKPLSFITTDPSAIRRR